MKHFGAKEGEASPFRRTPFTFGFHRNGEVATEQFTALIGKVDAGGLMSALRSVEERDDVGAATALYRVISRVLDNSDGIPSRWEPEAVRQEEGDNRPPVFRSPYGVTKGDLIPMSEAGEYLNSEVHSSRRRWLHLMERDEDAIVDFEDINKIFEWIIQESSGKASAASS